MVRNCFVLAVLLLRSEASAFQTAPSFKTNIGTGTALNTADKIYDHEGSDDNRRQFLTRGSATALAGLLTTLIPPVPDAQATLYLDPAMYGDQENRISAVDSCRETVRRSILQKPALAPAYYTMALLDALSFDSKSGNGGPDGKIIRTLLAVNSPSPYIADLKEAAEVLIAGKKSNNKLSAITIADSVAIGGAEAIQAIGGPILSVQVGRIDAPKDAKIDKTVPLDLFEGKRSVGEVRSFFQRSGMTDREMTALLCGLLTINKVEKDKDPLSWKQSGKPKYVERGKMGRASDYKKLSDEDFNELAKDEIDDDDDGLQDEVWYIAESFGTKDQAFGKKTGDLDVKSFNRYITKLSKLITVKNNSDQEFGWIGNLLLDRDTPSTQQWLAKYGVSYLAYNKDLGVAYNSVTQLGAEYTGGKYENLLKNKPRKSLNDD